MLDKQSCRLYVLYQKDRKEEHFYPQNIDMSDILEDSIEFYDLTEDEVQELKKEGRVKSKDIELDLIPQRIFNQIRGK